MDEEGNEVKSEGSLVEDDEEGLEESQKVLGGAMQLNAGMKKDRDNYKRKIQGLEKKLIDEDLQNERTI